MKCVDPYAPVAECVNCGKIVYTCERQNPINNSYACPLHPNGCETKDGWFCSEECKDNV